MGYWLYADGTKQFGFITGITDYYETEFQSMKDKENQPAEFLKEYLVPCAQHLATMLQQTTQIDNIPPAYQTTGGSQCKELHEQLHLMMCLPHVEWRAPALLAMELLLRPQERGISTDRPVPLLTFLRQLELLAVYLCVKAAGDKSRYEVYNKVLDNLRSIGNTIGTMNEADREKSARGVTRLLLMVISIYVHTRIHCFTKCAAAALTA